MNNKENEYLIKLNDKYNIRINYLLVYLININHRMN